MRTPGNTDPKSNATELLKAMANQIRLSIVLRLAEGEACVHDLVGCLHLPQPSVSQHLRILREARLIQGRRRGREVHYSLVDEHVARIARDALSHVSEEQGEE